MAAATRARLASKPYTPAPTRRRQSQRLRTEPGHALSLAPAGTPQSEVIKLRQMIDRILGEIPQDPDLKTWAVGNICDSLHAALQNRSDSDSPVPQNKKRKRPESQAPISYDDPLLKKRAEYGQQHGATLRSGLALDHSQTAGLRGDGSGTELSDSGSLMAHEESQSVSDAEPEAGEEDDQNEHRFQQDDDSVRDDMNIQLQLQPPNSDLDQDEEQSQLVDDISGDDTRSNADDEEMEGQQVDQGEEQSQLDGDISGDDTRSNADDEEMEGQQVDQDEAQSQRGDPISGDDTRSNADDEEMEGQQVDQGEEQSHQGDETPMGQDEASVVHMPSAGDDNHPDEDANGSLGEAGNKEDGLEVDDTSMGGVDIVDELNDIPLPVQRSQTSRSPCLEASPPHTQGLLSRGARRFSMSPSAHSGNQKLDTLAAAAASLNQSSLNQSWVYKAIRRDGDDVSATHTPTTNIPLHGLNDGDMDMRQQHEKYQQNMHATAVTAARALAEERDTLHRRHPTTFSTLWNGQFTEDECHKLPVVQSGESDDQVGPAAFEQEVHDLIRRWRGLCAGNSAALCEAVQLHNDCVQMIEAGARPGIINCNNTVVADAALVEDGSGQRPVPSGATQQTGDSSSFSPTDGNAPGFMAEDGVNAASNSSVGETVDAAGGGASSAEGSRDGSPVVDPSTDLEKINLSTPIRGNRDINIRGVSPFSNKMKFIMPGMRMREITIDRVNALFNYLNGLPYQANKASDHTVREEPAKKIISFFTEKTFTDDSIKRVKAVLEAYTSGEFRAFKSQPLLGTEINSLVRTEKMKALDDCMQEEIAARPFEPDPDGDLTDLAFRKQCYDTYQLHFKSLTSLKLWRETEADMAANPHAYPTKKVGLSHHDALIDIKARQHSVTKKQMGYRFWQWRVLEMLVRHFGRGVLLFADLAVYTRLARYLPRNAADTILLTICNHIPELRVGCTRLETDVMCFLVDTYDPAQGVPTIKFLTENEIVFDGSNAGSASPSPTPYAMKDRV